MTKTTSRPWTLVLASALLLASAGTAGAQRMQTEPSSPSQTSYTIATFDITPSLTWSGSAVHVKLVCQLISVDAVMVDGQRYDVASLPASVAGRIRGSYSSRSCGDVRYGVEILDGGRAIWSSPPGSADGTTWQVLFGRDVKTDINSSSPEGVAKIRNGTLTGRAHKIESRPQHSHIIREHLIAQRQAAKAAEDAKRVATTPAPRPAAPGGTVSIVGPSTGGRSASAAGASPTKPAP